MDSNSQLRFNFDKYIRSSNKDKIITVGQTTAGDYTLNIEQITDKGHTTIGSMTLVEKDFVCLTSAILMFADRYDMNLTHKMNEFLEPVNIAYMPSTLVVADSK